MGGIVEAIALPGGIDDRGGVGQLLKVPQAGAFNAHVLIENFLPGGKIHNAGLGQTKPPLGGNDGIPCLRTKNPVHGNQRNLLDIG